ncbi:MAG: ATP-binding protein [Ilumatobacteraceae bacterium]
MVSRARESHLDELLDRAVDAVNTGQLDVAQQLADEVLALDGDNEDLEALLGGPPEAGGVLRRPTIMFCDLVGSTELSARHDPEEYRRIIGRYKDTCREIIERTYGGRIMAVKGDGLLALYGFPAAHEDDSRRAVSAGLELLAALRRLSAQTERAVGEPLSARVAVHRGLVYIDAREGDVYGLAVNVAARLHELAQPGQLVVSSAVLRLLADQFEVRAQTPQKVKGVDTPLASWRVVGARPGGRARTQASRRVGRDRELDALRRAWTDRASAVLISGEAGIGKSYLANVFASELAAAGASVLRMPGSSIHRAALHPFRELLEQRCEIGRDATSAERLRLLRLHLEEHRIDSEAVLAALAAVLRIDQASGYASAPADGRKLHDQVVAAIGQYLGASLGAPDVLLIAEDAHWFDETTRQLLTMIVAARHEGLRVLITSRDEHVLGVDVPAGPNVIAIAPLADDEGAALIESLDPDGVTSSFRGELLARGAGVPLYIEELVRAAVESARDTEGRGDDVATVDSPAGRAGIPEVLYEPLVARLDAIDGSGDTVAAAAAFGEAFDLDLLVDVLGRQVDEVRPVVVALVSGRVLDPLPGPGERYRFRHDLFREAAEELQPPSARERVHGRVADVIRQSAVDDTAVDWLALARHYEIARRAAEAVECYERSAEDARRIGALAMTQERLGHAIDLVVSLPAGEARTEREIQLRLGRAFLATSVEGNGSAVAAADYERCLELALAGSSSEEILLTLIPLWAYYASRADLARATEVIELLRQVVVTGREWFGNENSAGFGMLAWFGGRFADAHERLERSGAHFASAGVDRRVASRWFVPNDPTASISTHLGLARGVRGDPAGAADAFDTADTIAAERPFPQGPYSAAYNQTYRAWTLTHLGSFDEAAAHADEALRLAETHGFDFWILAATTQRLAVDVHRVWREGATDVDLAEHAARLAGLLGMWQLIDVRVLLPSIHTVVAMASGRSGELDQAGRHLDDAIALADETGAHFYDAEIQRVRALLDPDPSTAAATLEDAFGIARVQGASTFQLRIAHDLYRLDAARGGPLVDEAIGAVANGATCPEIEQMRALVVRDVSVG